eukprot:PhF_6_TR8004/c1_g2_i6/m.12362
MFPWLGRFPYSWIFAHDGNWHDNTNKSTNPHPHFFQIYGFLLDPFNDQAMWFAGFEIAVSVITGAVVGMQHWSDTACVSVYCVLLPCNALGVIFAWRTKPFHTHRDLVVNMLCYGTAAVAVACHVVNRKYDTFVVQPEMIATILMLGVVATTVAGGCGQVIPMSDLLGAFFGRQQRFQEQEEEGDDEKENDVRLLELELVESHEKTNSPQKPPPSWNFQKALIDNNDGGNDGVNDTNNRKFQLPRVVDALGSRKAVTVDSPNSSSSKVDHTFNVHDIAHTFSGNLGTASSWLQTAATRSTTIIKNATEQQLQRGKKPLPKVDHLL